MARLLLALTLIALPASASTPDEWGFIIRSLRPSEVGGVQGATGGLSNLPLLEAEIHLDFAGRTVAGHATLDWRNDTEQPVSKLPIRFSSNGGSKGPKAGWNHVTVTLPGGKPVEATVHRHSKTISFVALPTPLPPGARVIVQGELRGVLSEISQGATDPVMASMGALMGQQKANNADGDQYGTFACGDDICTLTGFLPEVPAFIDGHFDTSEGSGIGDATYSVPMNAVFSVVTEHGISLAATGIEIGHISEGGGKDRWTFAMAATREVGVIASPGFAIDEVDVDGVRVRSFSRPADRAAGKHVLDCAASAVRSLSAALGPYPWAVLNVAESGLVGGAGGVELPGLALDASGFYQPGGGLLGVLGAAGGAGGNLTADILDFITRHEVAHQWWALQVGSHSQLHPYIDEPLAQWSALYTVEQSEGVEVANRMRQTQIAMNFQALAMMGIPDGVVARPAGKFHSNLEYAGLVYGKAPLFYEAAAKEMGEAKLLAALRGVVSEKRFNRVTPDELRTALVRAGGPPIQALWKRWFLERHGVEDVGTLDLGGLAGSLGLGGLGASPEDTANAMKQINDLMKQMGDSPIQ